MLFCLTCQYTAQSLKAMAENPRTDRHAAVVHVLEAAGGKLISMYGTAVHGPGAMVIFDVPDPEMAIAITGVAVSSGAVQDVSMTRLFSMDEVASVRQKRIKLTAAYKPPGHA